MRLLREERHLRSAISLRDSRTPITLDELSVRYLVVVQVLPLPKAVPEIITGIKTSEFSYARTRVHLHQNAAERGIMALA